MSRRVSRGNQLLKQIVTRGMQKPTNQDSREVVDRWWLDMTQLAEHAESMLTREFDPIGAAYARDLRLWLELGIDYPNDDQRCVGWWLLLGLKIEQIKNDGALRPDTSAQDAIKKYRLIEAIGVER